MRIPAPSRKEPAESIVPMINVVFLLLIFFLMTAQIAPPEPFEVAPPTAEDGADPTPGVALHVSAEGELGYEDARDEAAIAAAAAAERDGPLPLRADGELEASKLAAILSRLAAAGVARVEIAVAAQ